jgi:hypothetical protein
MRIIVRTRGLVPAHAAQVARQRLDFAVGRFAGRVRSLTVRLSDVNGPRGGRDKHCAIAVRLAGSRRLIVIEEVDGDVAVAIARAADRAARAVSRAVQISGRWHRTPLYVVE